MPHDGQNRHPPVSGSPQEAHVVATWAPQLGQKRAPPGTSLPQRAHEPTFDTSCTPRQAAPLPGARTERCTGP